MKIQLDFSTHDLVDTDDIDTVHLDCRPWSVTLVVDWKKGGTSYFESGDTKSVLRGYREILNELEARS